MTQNQVLHGIKFFTRQMKEAREMASGADAEFVRDQFNELAKVHERFREKFIEQAEVKVWNGWATQRLGADHQINARMMRDGRIVHTEFKLNGLGIWDQKVHRVMTEDELREEFPHLAKWVC